MSLRYCLTNTTTQLLNDRPTTSFIISLSDLGQDSTDERKLFEPRGFVTCLKECFAAPAARAWLTVAAQRVRRSRSMYAANPSTVGGWSLSRKPLRAVR